MAGATHVGQWVGGQRPSDGDLVLQYFLAYDMKQCWAVLLAFGIRSIGLLAEAIALSSKMAQRPLFCYCLIRQHDPIRWPFIARHVSLQLFF